MNGGFQVDFGIDLAAMRDAWNREQETPNDDHMSVEESLAQIASLSESWGQSSVVLRDEDDGLPPSVIVHFGPAHSTNTIDRGCLDVQLIWSVTSQGVDIGAVQWVSQLLRTFAARQGGVEVRRSVRFFIGQGIDHKRGKCAATIDVQVGNPCSVLVEGVLGDVAWALLRADHELPHGVTVRNDSARWTRLLGADPEGQSQLGTMVVALAHWWAHADPTQVVMVCQSLEELFVHKIDQAVAKGCPRTGMGQMECFSHNMEMTLAGLWQIRPLLGEDKEADDELEGWQREIEFGIRRRLDVGSAAFIKRSNFNGPRLSFEGAPEHIEWDRIYVPALPRDSCQRGGVPYLVHSQSGGIRGRSQSRGGLPPVPKELFDGERTLAEIVLRLCVETPVSWEEAARLVAAWVKKKYVRLAPPPDYALPDPQIVKGVKDIESYFDLPELNEQARSRTVLYFAYGSCMCRTSFRDTVPRYELVGSARLEGYRLGFTHISARRGGGTADIVPDPEGVVWGILYRIPRQYVYRLDAREGVFVNKYERQWVHVDALGTRMGPVLTYGVIEKASNEIAPSGEYAGLIWDGAYGMVEENYCREFLERLDQMGVEPISPL